MDAKYGRYLLSKAAEAGTLKEAEYGVRYSVDHGAYTNGYCTVTVWMGKSAKPVEYACAHSEEEAAKAVADYVARAKAWAEQKTKDKAEAKAKTAETRAKVEVGTVFYNSWGYDQTNVDYYEVVRKSATGATVWVRKLAKSVEETGFMCGRSAPHPGEYKGEELRKKVGPYGVGFPHGACGFHKDGETHACSWYA